MTNPWLRIPASDYEAHMTLPEVAQAQAIERLFASALIEHAPASLAVFGCSTGNGFEHIDPLQTRRVVGIDINPEYLAILKRRFAAKIPCLEVVEADFTLPGFRLEPVAMVFAALVFEYVNVHEALQSIERCMTAGAILVAVLQLPSEESAPVTPTQYKSLDLLAPIMRLVSPDEFSDATAGVGLQELNRETVSLKMGKAFFVGCYRKDIESSSSVDCSEGRLETPQ